MKFMLFTTDDGLAKTAAEATINRLVVDLENRGKNKRQHGYHLECNAQTTQDIACLSRVVSTPIVCRINPMNHRSSLEIEEAIHAGAQVLMLPMFRERSEVKRFVELVQGRVLTSLLFETPEAVALAPKIRDLPFDEVYVGLNDLSISLGLSFPYAILLTDTLDRMRTCFYDKPFGFGGITLLGKGSPLSTEFILKEQARLRCSNVILRRAFKRDVQNNNIRIEIKRLRDYYLQCNRRNAPEVEVDRLLLKAKIKGILSHYQEFVSCAA
jgi:hypothetical protein